jgi:hypothetical protein
MMSAGASILAFLNPLEWNSWTIAAVIVLCLVVRLFLPQSSSTVVKFSREALLVAPAAFLYFLVRGLVDARESDAVRNAERLIDIERAVGMHWEEQLQQWIIGNDWRINVVNWIYIWGHWPVVITAIVWLILFRHERFAVYRNALLISGAVGMVVFAVYPVAPPRLIDGLGFIDTVTERSNAYRVLQPPSLTNPYAAMPSLHFGWNLLIGIAIFREARAPLARAFGVAMPLLMFSSIVLTANHYIIDGLAGGALVLLALAIGEWLARPGHGLREIVFRPGISSDRNSMSGRIIAHP